MKNIFVAFAAQLKDANERHDWTLLEDLDKRIRSELEQAVANISSEQERLQVISFLTSYEKVYGLILRDSLKYRDEISEELKKVTRENKAANMYLDSSSYKS